MSAKPYNLDIALLRAHLALKDGRMEEGVEELRQAIFESTKLPPGSGRTHVERILCFATDNDVLEEVEETLHEEQLRRYLFGAD